MIIHAVMYTYLELNEIMVVLIISTIVLVYWNTKDGQGMVRSRKSAEYLASKEKKFKTPDIPLSWREITFTT